MGARMEKDAGYIGVAKMDQDGTIHLILRAETLVIDVASQNSVEPITGSGCLTYHPDHPQYGEIASHLPDLAPGHTCAVRPWPD
jgi:hypothetical protein